MKTALKILLGLFLLLFLALAGFWLYLKRTGPVYKGHIELGFHAPTDVYFDTYGIPHIYAQNAEDAYRALGYVHAQERLFQMEMIRRLVSGRLAEILGPAALKSDRRFLNLRLRERAEKTAQKWWQNPEDPFIKEANAYLQGINDFIDHGKTPIEFRMLHIPKRHFEPADIYSTIMYMTLGFTASLTEEPILTRIRSKLGPEYLQNWNIGTVPTPEDTIELAPLIGFQPIDQIPEELGLPVWDGSNGWVLAPAKSKSGKVLFANDTHIKFSQPSVWYEAHLEYPGFSFYGNFLAGVPFGIIGHNRHIAWGLTIFPMDNMDLYRERINPDDSSQVMFKGNWQPMQIIREVIPVKGDNGLYYDTLRVRVTPHGPILPDLHASDGSPIAVQWTALMMPTRFLQASRLMAHATNIQQARATAAQNDILGLNVLYGDADGNIAKWSSGKIPIRPDSVSGRFIMDGASGKDEWRGFYDFTENPQIENPACGFVASSNEAPPRVHGRFYPGFYPAEGRKERLVKRLTERDKWDIESLKTIHRDITSDVHRHIAQTLVQVLRPLGDSPLLDILDQWNGRYDSLSAGAVIYTKLAFKTMQEAIKDEIGQSDFDLLRGTYLFKNNYRRLIPDATSPWWDDVTTKDKRESRKDIVLRAFRRTEKELKQQLGPDPSQWKWSAVHTLTHVHPIGRKKPFDKYFNVGPFGDDGSCGVLNKQAFVPNDSGHYVVRDGPALRILLDFADLDHSISINPTGQSGSIFSPHYKDQALMYVQGRYRLQMMDDVEIRENGQKLSFK